MYRASLCAIVVSLGSACGVDDGLCSTDSDCAFGYACGVEGICAPSSAARIAGSRTTTGSSLRVPGEGTLQGVIGGRTGYDGPASVMGSTDRQYGSTNMTVTRDEPLVGFGMVILQTVSPLEDFEPGTYTFNTMAGDVFVNVCTNDYDAPANGTLAVEEGEGEVRIITLDTVALSSDPNEPANEETTSTFPIIVQR